MPYLSSEPEKIYQEDVQGGASVSESIGAKIGSSINYILDEFVTYHFGVSGAPYSGLSVYPYEFNNNIEAIKGKCEIQDIFITNQVSGISGATEFRIERQLAAGGGWTNIFSVNCSILNTAADGILFKESDVSAPAGVTLPVLSIVDFELNDKLRFVLVSAADQAQSLSIAVKARPVL